jgi:hypothetical protein
VILVAAVIVASALGSGSSDVAWSRTNVALRAERLPAADVAPGSPGTSRTWQSGPAALANRAAQSRADVARALGEAANTIGLRGLVGPERLRSPDSLRALRQAVASFRPAITHWRDAEAGVIAAYRDSAAALARSGRWDQAEKIEWRVRAPRSEALATMRTTDSLLLVLDRAYALMQESDQVDSAGHPRFGQPKAAAEYDWLRGTISRLVAQPVLPGEQLSAPLVILHSALGGVPLPARTVR